MANAGDSNFLIGEWISDKEKTIKYNREQKDWTRKELKIFKKILGKLQLAFTDNMVKWAHEEVSNSGEYKIVGNTENTITIQTKDTIENITYHKVGEWIYVDSPKSKSLLREYFRRVK